MPRRHPISLMVRVFFPWGDPLPSLSSGLDRDVPLLLAKIRRLSSRPRPFRQLFFLSPIRLRACWMLAAFLTFAPQWVLAAPMESVPATREGIEPAALDRSISEIIRKGEYAWRMPRERKAETPQNSHWLAWLKEPLDALKKAVTTIGRWGRDLVNYLNKFRRPTSGSPLFGIDFFPGLQWLLFFALAFSIALLAVLLLRMWKRSRINIAGMMEAQAALDVPDVADEEVRADQLPADRWLNLARELMEKGELRLALRALYLSSLADLAARQLITIARFKSNRDYERELGRRSHALPVVMEIFSRNVGVFDRAWYGLHPVTPEAIVEFSENVKRLQARA